MKILIFETRANKRITLEKLAEISGISKSTIQRIETGAVSPTLDHLDKLAKALGVKVTDLFESEYK